MNREEEFMDENEKNENSIVDESSINDEDESDSNRGSLFRWLSNQWFENIRQKAANEIDGEWERDLTKMLFLTSIFHVFGVHTVGLSQAFHKWKYGDRKDKSYRAMRRSSYRKQIQSYKSLLNQEESKGESMNLSSSKEQINYNQSERDLSTALDFKGNFITMGTTYSQSESTSLKQQARNCAQESNALVLGLNKNVKEAPLSTALNTYINTTSIPETETHESITSNRHRVDTSQSIEDIAGERLHLSSFDQALMDTANNKVDEVVLNLMKTRIKERKTIFRAFETDIEFEEQSELITHNGHDVKCDTNENIDEFTKVLMSSDIIDTSSTLIAYTNDKNNDTNRTHEMAPEVSGNDTGSIKKMLFDSSPMKQDVFSMMDDDDENDGAVPLTLDTSNSKHSHISVTGSTTSSRNRSRTSSEIVNSNNAFDTGIKKKTGCVSTPPRGRSRSSSNSVTLEVVNEWDFNATHRLLKNNEFPFWILYLHYARKDCNLPNVSFNPIKEKKEALSLSGLHQMMKDFNVTPSVCTWSNVTSYAEDSMKISPLYTASPAVMNGRGTTFRSPVRPQGSLAKNRRRYSLTSPSIGQSSSSSLNSVDSITSHSPSVTSSKLSFLQSPNGKSITSNSVSTSIASISEGGSEVLLSYYAFIYVFWKICENHLNGNISGDDNGDSNNNTKEQDEDEKEKIKDEKDNVTNALSRFISILNSSRGRTKMMNGSTRRKLPPFIGQDGKSISIAFNDKKGTLNKTISRDVKKHSLN